MEEKAKKTFKIISIFNALFILLCAGGCVYVIGQNCGVYFSVTGIVELIALVFSVLYYAWGYNKDASKYYRLFMLFYAFTYLAEITASALSFSEIDVQTFPLTVVFSMVLYGNTLILATGKDLGKKVSLSLCIANAVAYAVPLVGAMIPDMIEFGSEQTKVAVIILYCSWFILALNALLMTVAKYVDKTQRGTK